MNVDSVWDDAEAAAAVLGVLGWQLGGVNLRCFPGPIRDTWLARIESLMPTTPLRRIPGFTHESRLLGGIDLAATLKSGSPIAERGLLAECHGQIAVVSMAERLERSTVAHLSRTLDTGSLTSHREGLSIEARAQFAIIALDEGLDDEAPHPALTDRLGINLDLSPLSIHDVGEPIYSERDVVRARDQLTTVRCSEEQAQHIVQLCDALGIFSNRAMILAVRICRALAALRDDHQINDDDIRGAMRLCLIPRATQLPQQTADLDAPTPPEPPPEESQANNVPEQPETSTKQPPVEEIIEAIIAELPPGLLAALQAKSNAQRRRSSVAGKSGQRRRDHQRGRPLGHVRGDHRRGGKLDLVATLRQAIPWQTIRKQSLGRQMDSTVVITASDLCIKRFKQRRQSATIFAVDVSGSAALQRLAEAKGAVELLLADCYVRRDEVAVITFRGHAAALLLPPTRSLVRAKRAIAGVAGGGGTPLAAGLESIYNLHCLLERQGVTPHYVLLTDGAANVARSGETGRDVGTEDALTAAAVLRDCGATGIVIDTAQRPQQRARTLSETLEATYVALPKASAQALSQTIRANQAYAS